MTSGWTRCSHYDGDEQCPYVAFEGDDFCPEHAEQDA